MHLKFIFKIKFNYYRFFVPKLIKNISISLGINIYLYVNLFRYIVLNNIQYVCIYVNYQQ